MKLPKNIIMLILAILGVAFTMIWFTLLLFVEVPTTNRDLVTMASGYLLAKCVGVIYDYYFGSSSGSASKQETIDRKLNQPPD